MAVHTEVITLLAERGGSIRKCRHRNVGAAANLLDLGVHPIVPTEDRLRSRCLRELVTYRNRELASGSVSRPMFAVGAENLKSIGLDVNAQERRNRLATDLHRST